MGLTYLSLEVNIYGTLETYICMMRYGYRRHISGAWVVSYLHIISRKFQGYLGADL